MKTALLFKFITTFITFLETNIYKTFHLNVKTLEFTAFERVITTEHTRPNISELGYAMNSSTPRLCMPVKLYYNKNIQLHPDMLKLCLRCPLPDDFILTIALERYQR